MDPLKKTGSDSTGTSTPNSDNATMTDIYTSSKNNVNTSHTRVIHSNARQISHHVGTNGKVHLDPEPSSRSRKIKVKEVVKFEPRLSHFDPSNEQSQHDIFRGFYVLFWLVLVLFTLKTWLWNYAENGSPFRFRFTSLISEDGLVLAISDGVLVSLTILCVPFVKAIQKGYIRYHWTGATFQHLFQTLYLATAIRWTFHRQWFWVQSGFLTLHTFTMIMKIHSYCAHNGYLSEKHRELESCKKTMKILMDDLGGAEKLIKEAQVEKLRQVAGEQTSFEEAVDDNPNVATSTSVHAKTKTTESSSHASLQRRRRSSAHNQQPTQSSAKQSAGDIISILEYHPREDVSDLAITINDLKGILTSDGPEKVVWPNNITYRNFVDYLLVPTLVYELEYPRTNTIRPIYVLERTLATFGTLSLVLIVTEHYIYPAVNRNAGQSFIVFWLDLAPSFIVNFLLIFFIIFECVCNGFAELTKFADRHFYDDWWNSANFEQFSKRWNRPVHMFLLRHVYTSTLMTYSISKFQASFLTFFLSACVHELLMAVVTKKIRLYLFAMQMAQLPLIMLGRANMVKRHPTLGNVFFWLGLISGFPLLAVAYLRW